MGLLSKIKDRLQNRVPSGMKRSKQWPTVRKAYLKKHPTCAMCGGNKKIEVHHVIPFHVDPSLELRESNLMTLCEAKKYGVTCHQFFGHLGDYRDFNFEVRKDAQDWHEKLFLARLGVLKK